MLEIGFPVAAAMAALCLDPGLRRGEHMELSRELLTAEMIDPSTGEPARTTIEVRRDPLTGHSSTYPARARPDARQRLRP